jgi:hypothetical protein
MVLIGYPYWGERKSSSIYWEDASQKFNGDIKLLINHDKKKVIDK